MRDCYLKKYTVGILGNSPMLAEMLLKSGVGEVHLISKVVSVEEMRRELGIYHHDVGDFLETSGFRECENLTIYRDVLKGSKGCDILIDCGFREEGAKIAKRLGVPYVTEPEVSVLLPEALEYEELKLSKAFESAEELHVVRILQGIETLKCLRGGLLPALSPEALKFDEKSGEIKKINLI
jgi:hypothetical protein